MSKANFPKVLNKTLVHEGGYVDHPEDPGGATNFGVTLKTLSEVRGRTVTKAEVKALTVNDVMPIYKDRYWDAVRGNDLPDGFDYVAFDGAVNSGVKRGARWLQKGLRVTADGAIGPVTIRASRAAGPDSIERACDARMSFLQGLRHWSTFGKGWSRRVAEVEASATAMLYLATNNASGAKTHAERIVVTTPKRVATQKTAAKVQTAGAGGGAAGGVSTLPDVTGWQIGLVCIGLLVVLVLILARSRRRIEYQEERAKAMAQMQEELL